MWKRYTIAAILTLALAVGVPLAIAGSDTAEQPDGAPVSVKTGAADTGPGHGPLGQFLRKRLGKLRGLQQELDLTDEQRTGIHDIILSYKQDLARAAQAVAEDKRALREAVVAENPDENTIRAESLKMANSIGDMAVLLSDVVAEVRLVLTEQQIEVLQEAHADRTEAVDRLLEQLAR